MALESNIFFEKAVPMYKILLEVSEMCACLCVYESSRG